MILFSVIIPTFNRWESLQGTLLSLFRQEFDKSSFEIIVVDDGSSDETDSETKKIMEREPNLRYFRQTNSGPAKARNLGLSQAKGSIVAFIDSDALADKKWLANAKIYFDRQDVFALEGKIITPAGSKIGLFSHYFENPRGGLYQTCNMFFRKDVLLSVGGFDERFKKEHFFREDSDLIFSLAEKGYPIEQIPFAPDVIASHPPRKESPLSIINRAKRYQWDPLLYKKHPALYKKYIGGAIDGWSNLILISSVFMLLAALRHSALLVIAGLALMILVYAAEIAKAVMGKSFSAKELSLYILLSLAVPIIRIAYLLKGNYHHKVWLW
jgi:glycosyltransferase involved in cell wall biosynthesis